MRDIRNMTANFFLTLLHHNPSISCFPELPLAPQAEKAPAQNPFQRPSQPTMVSTFLILVITLSSVTLVIFTV